VVTVSIAEWDLTCNLFDGETALGPVPRLFAANPEEALAALNSDEVRAFRDLQRIMAKFIVPENIPPHKAWDFLNNVRYKYSFTIRTYNLSKSVSKSFHRQWRVYVYSIQHFQKSLPPQTISKVIKFHLLHPLRPAAVTFGYKMGYQPSLGPPAKRSKTSNPDPAASGPEATTTGNIN
jgi:hypothetical protein